MSINGVSHIVLITSSVVSTLNKYNVPIKNFWLVIWCQIFYIVINYTHLLEVMTLFILKRNLKNTFKGGPRHWT